MTNEEAATLLEQWSYKGLSDGFNEAATMGADALRSHDTGAEAMREALESYDYWIENATTGSDRAALRRASDALADYVRCALPLPAPEVPDVVRHFIECYDHDPMSGATRIAMRDLRSLYRKEYGI